MGVKTGEAQLRLWLRLVQREKERGNSPLEALATLKETIKAQSDADNPREQLARATLRVVR